MNAITQIFNPKLLKARLDAFADAEIPDLPKKRARIAKWQYSIENSDLSKTKETAVQGMFFEQIFDGVLGYASMIGNKTCNIQSFLTSKSDSSVPDGSLGFFSSGLSDVHAVIELKDAKTDLDKKQSGRTLPLTPVEQGFSYAPKAGGHCRWVIISNFREIRLYRSSSVLAYEKFDLMELGDPKEFKRFYYLLCCRNLISAAGASVIDELYAQNETQERDITKEFYQQYRQARKDILAELKRQNPDRSENDLVTHTQKLLDRFLFVFFAEDKGLLPHGVFRRALEAGRKSFELSDQKIWPQMRGLFASIDKGNPPLDIHCFNGGLFAPDAPLDSLRIPDSLFPILERLVDYDFETDLNVNVLGHIFEQSIADIEELRAGAAAKPAGKTSGKRKRDGIFYTPENITRFIVEEAIGGRLAEIRRELGEETLPELPAPAAAKTPADKRKRTQAVAEHKSFWQNYKDRLTALTVLDPACGSGAFLNQAFDYLHAENGRVNRLLSDLGGGAMDVFESLDRVILRQNLFGVDLNAESVEITKLSLWLKTASKQAALTELNDNIRCGNSLVDDPAVAGDKAFDWQDAFPAVMAAGGFDVVVGNPPYVRQETLGEAFKVWSKAKFETASGTADLYVYFYEQAHRLLKPGGRFGFISSNKFMRAGYGKGLRDFLVKNATITTIVDFGDLPVFEDATAYPVIVLMKKTLPPGGRQNFIYAAIKRLDFPSLTAEVATIGQELNEAAVSGENWTLASRAEGDIIEKMKQAGVPLGQYGGAKIYRGVLTGLNEAFVIDQATRDRLVKEDPHSAELLKPFAVGDEVRRYHIRYEDKWLIFTRRGTDLTQYPAIEKHLLQFRQRLEPKPSNYTGNDWPGRKPGSYKWYEIQDSIDYFKEFEKPKIVYPEISMYLLT